MITIQVWSDGSTVRNPGPGGWAALLVNGDKGRIVGGYAGHTTINRMETAGVAGALAVLKYPVLVELFTDSMYVVYGMRKIVAGFMPKTNQDVWEWVARELRQSKVRTTHVHGHTNVQLNELIDTYAGHCSRTQSSVDIKIENLPEFLAQNTKKGRKAK